MATWSLLKPDGCLYTSPPHPVLKQIKRQNGFSLYLGDKLAYFLWVEVTGLLRSVNQNRLHLLETGDRPLHHGTPSRGTDLSRLLPALSAGTGIWLTVLVSTEHLCVGHTSHLCSVFRPIVTSSHFSMLTVVQLGKSSSTS